MALERHERVRGDWSIELHGNTPVESSAANARTRCRKPDSPVGVHFSRPSCTAYASNDARVAADRPEARSTARLLSSTQPSRPRKKTMALSGR